MRGSPYKNPEGARAQETTPGQQAGIAAVRSAEFWDGSVQQWLPFIARGARAGSSWPPSGFDGLGAIRFAASASIALIRSYATTQCGSGRAKRDGAGRRESNPHDLAIGGF